MAEASGGSGVTEIFRLAELCGFPDELRTRLIASYVNGGKEVCVQKARELENEYPDYKRALMKVANAVQRS